MNGQFGLMLEDENFLKWLANKLMTTDPVKKNVEEKIRHKVKNKEN